ncbi:MAG: hypothetical protein ACPGLV_10670 [Bacteroidia bacterium]
MEHKFTTYLRTKEFLSKRFKEDNNDFVYSSVKVLYEQLGKRYKQDLNLLIKAEEVDWKPTKYKNAFRLRAKKPGAINLSLIKRVEQALLPHHRAMKKTLNAVECIGCHTPYFKLFLNNKRFIDHFFKVDSFSGRVHTPITNGLTKDERKHLLIQGQHTASFDVATIQPILLADFLNFKIGDNDFTKWVFNGEDVYLHIQHRMSLKTRGDAKKAFYAILYGKPSQELFRVFESAPWLDFINELKTQKVELNPRTQFKPHSNLAFVLQKIEVEFFNRYWKELVRQDIPFLSVHDEIITRDFDIEQSIELFHHVFGTTFKEIPYYKLNVEVDRKKFVVLKPECDKKLINSLKLENGNLIYNGYPSNWDTPKTNAWMSTETMKIVEFVQSMDDSVTGFEIAKELYSEFETL